MWETIADLVNYVERNLQDPQKSLYNHLLVIQEALYRVAMYTVGAMPFPTQRGKKYVLMVVDFALATLKQLF